MSQENATLMANEIVITIADNMITPVTFKTAAKTLGELKVELDKRDINYSGKVFREGNTVTELLNDETVLPRTKGDRPLTELFIMMTAAKKNIGSGNKNPEDMTRNELVAACIALVKERPELKAEFGSITTTKSCDLIALFKKFSISKSQTETPKTSTLPTNTETEPIQQKFPEVTTQVISNEWVKVVGIKVLEGVIEALKNVPMEVYVEVVKSSFSKEDIAKMSELLSK